MQIFCIFSSRLSCLPPTHSPGPLHQQERYRRETEAADDSEGPSDAHVIEQNLEDGYSYCRHAAAGDADSRTGGCGIFGVEVDH